MPAWMGSPRPRPRGHAPGLCPGCPRSGLSTSRAARAPAAAARGSHRRAHIHSLKPGILRLSIFMTNCTV